jgi:hypothetical protein
MKTYQSTAWKEGHLFVVQCLGVDVVSQGESSEEALANLHEAVELFLETASPEEVRERLHEGVRIAPFEVAAG